MNEEKTIQEIKMENKSETNPEEPLKEKPKKKKGCLVAILIALGVILLFILVIVIRINIMNSASYRINQAKEFLEKGEYKDAITYANFAIDNDPTDEEKQEAEKIAKEAQQKNLKIRKNEIQSAIQITKLWYSDFDSVGGVELYINYINKSEKTIKYVDFGVTFYNAVGDPITSGTGISEINNCQDVGPFAPGEGRQGADWHWGKFYNSTINSVKLVRLTIEYTDGSKLEMNTPEEAQLAMY